MTLEIPDNSAANCVRARAIFSMVVAPVPCWPP